MHRRRLVRVPASSANLGPGFDVLAAALALHVELEVEETGRFAVHTDLQIARDRRNLAVRAFETLHPADGFEFTIRSDVPLSGGLGTSAAAYVAGLIKHGARGATRVVCVLTGHGLKDPQTALEQSGSVVPCEPSLKAVEQAILA